MKQAALLVALAVAALSALSADRAFAQPAQPTPFQRMGYDQRVGQKVPTELAFRDEAGRTVRLGDYFGRRPVVLALVYYTCPMLCTMTMSGLTSSLKGLPFDAGKDYEVVVVSFDPKDTPAAATKAKADAMSRYGRPATAAGWHFLTGDPSSIARLTQAVGFRYFYDEPSHQYAHPAGIVVLTPDAVLSRYFYGIEYPSRNVRLGLVEAADNKIGTVVDQVLLFCFHYDPTSGKYSAVVLNIVRLSAIATVIGLLLMIALLRRRDQQPKTLGTA